MNNTCTIRPLATNSLSHITLLHHHTSPSLFSSTLHSPSKLLQQHHVLCFNTGNTIAKHLVEICLGNRQGDHCLFPFVRYDVLKCACHCTWCVGGAWSIHTGQRPVCVLLVWVGCFLFMWFVWVGYVSLGCMNLLFILHTPYRTNTHHPHNPPPPHTHTYSSHKYTPPIHIYSL